MVVLCANCASEPTQNAESLPSSPVQVKSAVLESLKLGMSRNEVEQLLGEPASVTDTAEGSTLIWVFGRPTATPQPAPSSSGLFRPVIAIATTVASIFSPIASVASSLGSQVYSAGSSAMQNSSSVPQTTEDQTRVITIEFKDNLVYSIQRAKPANLAPAVPIH